jgi:hypothetical protein
MTNGADVVLTVQQQGEGYDEEVADVDELLLKECNAGE